MADNQFSNPGTASTTDGNLSFENGNTPSQLAADSRPAFNFESGRADEAGTTALTQEGGGSASALKDKALNRLQTEADNRKGAVSGQLKQVSSALAGIGGDQSGETPQWLSSGVGQVTQFIDKVADNVENRNSAELLNDVRDLARANPALFLGAFALAGFVAVRVLTAAGDGQ